MAKAVRFTQRDRDIIERLAHAREVASAYRRARGMMRRQLKRVADDLAAVAKASGYELYPETEWAEFKAYRPEWCLEGSKPIVECVVGGLFPIGYFSVEHPTAYVCLMLTGVNDKSTEDNRQFADVLYRELGGKPPEFIDRTDDPEWTSPLYAEIPDTDDRTRSVLAQDPNRLRALATEHFQRLFQFGDAVSRAVQVSASS